ncbi:MAG: hypothetical protein DPW09_16935 [Anaerolineae bacterium]|nr:hypothetical protein [Anaerolineales bacterium]MCQ3975128.1 hypothetical protein [Anaerolineae bacterium]
MSELTQLPEWLGGAVIGAIIAALGYVAKLIFDEVVAAREARNVRLARLVELHSLLRAGKACFLTQNAHAERLTNSITMKHLDLEKGKGYEEIMSKAFAQFTLEEKELHRIIRGITVHAMRPINQSLSEWLKKDTYFKAQQQGRGDFYELSKLLTSLDVHLLLWHAKYEEWIPDTPEHALVYLADEKGHGVGFPSGLDEKVAKIIEEASWIDFWI